MCIGVSRIFGEDCGFKNFNLNLILTCNISLITLLVFVTGAVAVVFLKRLEIIREHKIQDGDVNKNVKCEFMVFQSSSQLLFQLTYFVKCR